MVAFDATWNCRLRESRGSRSSQSRQLAAEMLRGRGQGHRGAKGGTPGASYGVPGPERATTAGDEGGTETKEKSS